MATLRNKRKLAAINRDKHEESCRSNHSRNTIVPGIKEEIFSQVSEEIDGRVTKNLSQGFSGKESRSLGALSKLGEFLLIPQVRVHSGSDPDTSRKSHGENQETNDHRSEIEFHHEVGTSFTKSLQNSDPEETSFTNQYVYQSLFYQIDKSYLFSKILGGLK